jgi:uncharacterized protein (TIGR04255 family)
VEGHPPILRNSPLQGVVIELRFPAAVYLPEDLKQIRQRLKDAYPISDVERGVGIELSLEGGIRQQETRQRQVFRSLDGAHQIGLSETALALEGRGPSYEGFERFLDHWLAAAEVVIPIAEVTSQLRLGMRYVNQLRVDDGRVGIRALDQRINPALLSPLHATGFKFDIETSFQQLQLRLEHGKATLRHGLMATPQITPGMIPPVVTVPDTTVPGVYVIDIDSYDDQLKAFDLDAHKETLKRLNSEVWQLFRWSITDDEYALMQPEERA